jgi:ketosteroid isomerase-like protein
LTQSARPREVALRLLQAAISPHPEDMADCYAAEVVIEMPFAIPGIMPQRTQTTREDLRARFASGSAIRRYTNLDRSVIHETTDPEVIIADYDLHGHLVATGETFTMSYLMILTIRDGQITRSRDYTDPIAGARILGRVPQLIEALTAT